MFDDWEISKSPITLVVFTSMPDFIKESVYFLILSKFLEVILNNSGQDWAISHVFIKHYLVNKVCIQIHY